MRKVFLRAAFVQLFFFFLFLNSLFAEINRVVSVVPSITKQLIYFKAQEKIVGCSSYCKLAKDKNVQIVGNIININVEKIYSLKPDIVFVSNMTDIRDVEKLKKLGINVAVFSYPKSIEEFFTQVKEIGKLAGYQKEANKAINISKKLLIELSNRCEVLIGKKVFMEIGVKPLYSVPKDTYLNDFLLRLGLINITGELKDGIINREYVIKENPDIIMIMDMGYKAKEEVSYWHKFKFLNAVKNNKIILLEADKVASPALPEFFKYFKKVLYRMCK